MFANYTICDGFVWSDFVITSVVNRDDVSPERNTNLHPKEWMNTILTHN